MLIIFVNKVKNKISKEVRSKSINVKYFKCVIV